MKRHSAFIALAAAIIGATLFSLPDQASKLSGGRKLAEATGVIVERTCGKTQKPMMPLRHQQCLHGTSGLNAQNI